MAKKEKAVNPGKVGVGKFWAWQTRGVSAAVNFLVLSFLMIFLTDAQGMPPALAGTIIMVVGLLEAGVDLFAGFLVDRTKSKIGVGRPFELAIVGLWGATWLIYSVPEALSIPITALWVGFSLFSARAFFATLLSAAQNAFMVRAFETEEQKVKVASFGGIVIMLCSIVVSISFPMLMGRIATSAAGWSRLIGLFAVPMTFLGLLRFICIKETVKIEADNNKERAKISDVFILLKNNKYIHMVVFMWLAYSMVTGMGVSQFFYQWITGDIANMGRANMMAILVIPVLVIFPALIKKFSTGKLIVGGSFMYIISGMLFFVSNGNMSIVIPAVIFSGLGSLPITYLTDLLLIDCGSYNLHKNNQRMDGTIGSLRQFFGNIGSAFGSGILGVLLGISGYDGTLAYQPDSALFLIRSLMGFAPIILFGAVAVVFIFFYKMDKELAVIKEKEEARAI